MSGGAYSNYYKAERDAQANPRNYATATSAIQKALQEGGYDQSWLRPTLELVARESSFNHQAANPKSSARGLFQFLDATRANKAYNQGITNWSDPYQQAVAGLRYIKSRYGTPEKALEFWDKNKWY